MEVDTLCVLMPKSTAPSPDSKDQKRDNEDAESLGHRAKDFLPSSDAAYTDHGNVEILL